MWIHRVPEGPPIETTAPPSQECAENMSFRVDKAWRQRCSQRFRNILDMVAKKAGSGWKTMGDPLPTFTIGKP